MAEDKNRNDSSSWRGQRPAEGASTEEFKDWAKKNPNRSSDAARTRRTVKSSEVTNVPRVRTKAQKNERRREVSEWMKTRPESGTRQDYIAWAAKNPNRVSNAARVGAAETNAAKAAKKAPVKKAAVKKAAAPKKGKKK